MREPRQAAEGQREISIALPDQTRRTFQAERTANAPVIECRQPRLWNRASCLGFQSTT